MVPSSYWRKLTSLCSEKHILYNEVLQVKQLEHPFIMAIVSKYLNSVVWLRLLGTFIK